MAVFCNGREIGPGDFGFGDIEISGWHEDRMSGSYVKGSYYDSSVGGFLPDEGEWGVDVEWPDTAEVELLIAGVAAGSVDVDISPIIDEFDAWDNAEDGFYTIDGSDAADWMFSSSFGRKWVSDQMAEKLPYTGAVFGDLFSGGDGESAFKEMEAALGRGEEVWTGAADLSVS